MTYLTNIYRHKLIKTIAFYTKNFIQKMLLSDCYFEILLSHPY